MLFRRLFLSYGALLALFSVVLPAQDLPLRGEKAARSQVIPNRYAVELTGEPVITRLAAERRTARAPQKLDLRGAAAARHRTAIAAEQAQARVRVEALGGRVLDSIDGVANQLFITLPADKAAELAKLPGVKRVMRDHLYYPNLDRAVQIHKAPDVWAAVGEDKAGLGVRVGIIDTGIDNGHPGLQDPSLPAIPGFPQVSNNSNRIYTNSKVIVARSYPNLWPVGGDPDTSARDRVGHGTACAMIAAGIRNTSPYGSIQGMAPKAYLGNYKVIGTPGVNDGASTLSILKAVNDAIGDGMDVLNLSLGSLYGYDALDDPFADLVTRVSDTGVLFVVAAGNDGPDTHTVGDLATVPQVIATGAISNDRIFAGSASLSGGGSYPATPYAGITATKSITAKLVDLSTITKTGEACTLPAGTDVKGDVVLISILNTNPGCTLSTQIRTLMTAGATAAIGVLFQSYGPSEGYPFFTGTPPLPLSLVTYGDGQALRKSLAANADQTVTLTFNPTPQPVSSSQFAGFSAFGPTDAGLIKPDLLAVGLAVVTATQKFDRTGEMYDSSGYTVANGTSFSSPMVAGAAALLKSARPGLAATAYRSLLINNTSIFLPDGETIAAPVQQTGSGVLDVSAAYRATVSAEPTSLSFGVQGYTTNFTQSLRLTNLSASAETYTLTATARNGGRLPRIGTSSVTLAPGQQRDVTIILDGTGLTSGATDGFIRIRGSVSGMESRVPYFFAVPGVPARITIVSVETPYLTGQFEPYAFFFRVYDTNGVPITSVTPTVTVESGGGSVALVRLSEWLGIPYTYGVNVRLGPNPGANVFRITVGDATTTVSIQGVTGN